MGAPRDWLLFGIGLNLGYYIGLLALWCDRKDRDR